MAVPAVHNITLHTLSSWDEFVRLRIRGQSNLTPATSVFINVPIFPFEVFEVVTDAENAALVKNRCGPQPPNRERAHCQTLHQEKLFLHMHDITSCFLSNACVQFRGKQELSVLVPPAKISITRKQSGQCFGRYTWSYVTVNACGIVGFPPDLVREFISAIEQYQTATNQEFHLLCPDPREHIQFLAYREVLRLPPQAVTNLAAETAQNFITTFELEFGR